MAAGEPRQRHAIELALAGLTVALAIFTVLVVIVPAVQPALLNDRLDTSISSAAALIGLSVAGLAWVRYVELRELRALLQGSAFAVLGAFNLVTVLVAISQENAAASSAPVDAGELPILGGIVVRAVSTALLIAAGLAGERRARLTPPRSARDPAGAECRDPGRDRRGGPLAARASQPARSGCGRTPA